MELKTNFASPERSSPNELDHGLKLLGSEKLFLDIFGAISGIAAVIDNNRQIIYGNAELLTLLGIDTIEQILGKRPGEAVSCIHSTENIYGCGTSEACSVCGAVNAIITSQQTGKKTVRETRITSIIEGKQIAWDLKVTSSPIIVKDKQYFIFTLQDISSEKRKENLERTFFHDLLNSAGSLNGLLNILKDSTNPTETKEIIELSEEASKDMLDEILLHRQLRAAENGDLIVDFQLYNPIDLLKSAVGKIEGNTVTIDKQIIIVDNSSGLEITTDRILIQRVLMNLLKNALEATPKGGIVHSEISELSDRIRFSIKNNTFMPKEVQLQVFQRSFSTKGTGRGVGTYSIKMISENYLKGIVGFTSSESEGTVFFVDLFKSLEVNITVL